MAVDNNDLEASQPLTSSSAPSDDVEMTIKSETEGSLPQPAAARTPVAKPKLSASTIIPIWIVLSSSVIIYNNYIYNTLEFKFPVFMVTWHLVFAVSCCLRGRRRWLSYLSARAEPRIPQGYWNACIAADDSLGGWGQGYQNDARYFPPFHPPYWYSLQWQSGLEQHRLSVPFRFLYSDAQGG